MPENTRIGKGFDKLALIYDQLVFIMLGKRLERLQEALLANLPSKGNALIVGGGSGKILTQALAVDLAREFIYVELSVQMQKRTRKRLSQMELQRVDFDRSIDHFKDEKTFDYILLPFVLDCYPKEQIAHMLSRFKALLKPDGSILLFDFNLEIEHGFRGHIFHRLLLRILYSFFRFSTGIPGRKLAPFNHVFLENGFFRVSQILHSKGWLQASQWKLEDKADAMA